MQDTKSPCAADALFGTKAITVAEKTIGIARLCDAIADVRAMNLSGDAAVKTALPARVGRENYIPEKFSGQYADALLAEYRRTSEKGMETERS